MQKIINVSLVAVLFLIAILTIGFVGQQKYKNQKVYSGNMKNLTIKNDLQDYGVEVIRPDEPEFNVELLRYIGDRNELIPMIESAKPFSLIIRNNSGKDIVGISLNWGFENSEGRIQDIERSSSTPGILMAMKPLDQSMVGKTSLLYNKDSRFFSFIPSIEQSIINTRKSVENPAVDFRTSPEQIKEYENELALRQADVDNKNLIYSVDIDGIVFSDGIFVGKNANSLFEQLNGLIQARKDFVNKLRQNRLEKINDSDSINQITSEFTNRKMTSNSGDKLSPQEVYQRSYESELSSLCRELKMKKTKISDDSAIDYFVSSKTSEFITLKKLN